jgi:hypothetical protein
MSSRAGFDFTAHAARLCGDMVARLDALRHIDLGRVAMSFCQTRKTTRFGRYASLTPLRFAGGQTHTMRRGRRWTVQRLVAPDGREMLYILNFYLPRFLDLPFREKLTTVVHELWHVSPQFDGDVRRHAGRCFAHGASREHYDVHAAALAERWLATGPEREVYEFLEMDFAQLTARFGRVFGRRVPNPKLIPAD